MVHGVLAAYKNKNIKNTKFQYKLTSSKFIVCLNTSLKRLVETFYRPIFLLTLFFASRKFLPTNNFNRF